jgi:hypothetical protein
MLAFASAIVHKMQLVLDRVLLLSAVRRPAVAHCVDLLLFLFLQKQAECPFAVGVW